MFFVLVIFVLMVYIGSPVSALVARTYVEKQHTYFIFADKPNIAVIRLYQDMILAMPFDEKTKELDRYLIIRKIDTQPIELVRKKIGPLKLKPLNPPKPPVKPADKSSARACPE